MGYFLRVDGRLDIRRAGRRRRGSFRDSYGGLDGSRTVSLDGRLLANGDRLGDDVTDSRVGAIYLGDGVGSAALGRGSLGDGRSQGLAVLGSLFLGLFNGAGVSVLDLGERVGNQTTLVLRGILGAGLGLAADKVKRRLLGGGLLLLDLGSFWEWGLVYDRHAG